MRRSGDATGKGRRRAALRPAWGRAATAALAVLGLAVLSDESFGLRLVVAEPPDFARAWTVRMAGVRVGGTFVMIDESEILPTTGSEPSFTDDEFATVLEHAVDLVRSGG